MIVITSAINMEPNNSIVTIENPRLAAILHYAMRYALARMTYASNDVATAIIDYWHVFTEPEKAKIRDEIREAIEKGKAGADCDVREWKKIIDCDVREWEKIVEITL